MNELGTQGDKYFLDGIEVEPYVIIDAVARRSEKRARRIKKLKARIAELEEERRWIPVGERLPELDQDVLAIVDDRIVVGNFYEDTEHGVYFSSGDDCMNVATHWMPLPKFPEVEQ